MSYTLNQMILTGIYEKFHPTAAEYMFFSSAHKHLPSGINHILDQKLSLNKFNFEIMSVILSDHYSMKLETNKRRKAEKLKNVEMKLQTPNNQ